MWFNGVAFAWFLDIMLLALFNRLLPTFHPVVSDESRA
jgi:hypothetical protein